MFTIMYRMPNHTCRECNLTVNPSEVSVECFQDVVQRLFIHYVDIHIRVAYVFFFHSTSIPFSVISKLYCTYVLLALSRHGQSQRDISCCRFV